MFTNIGTEELQEELKRRQEKSKPKLLDSPNIKLLQAICQNYINDLERDSYIDDDREHYIFEVAMETVFGKDIWTYVNNILLRIKWNQKIKIF